MQEKPKKKGLKIPKVFKKLGSKISSGAQEKIDDIRFAKPEEITENNRNCGCLGCEDKIAKYPGLLQAHEEHVARKDAKKAGE